MVQCGCCFKEKTDAHFRPGLYPVDDSGKVATKAYVGFLCEDCLAKARSSGTPEHRWLLRQVSQPDTYRRPRY
jgi:hypothetical protein